MFLYCFVLTSNNCFIDLKKKKTNNFFSSYPIKLRSNPAYSPTQNCRIRSSGVNKKRRRRRTGRRRIAAVGLFDYVAVKTIQTLFPFDERRRDTSGGREKKNQNIFKHNEIVKAAVSSPTAAITSLHQDCVPVKKEIKKTRHFIIKAKKKLLPEMFCDEPRAQWCRQATFLVPSVFWIIRDWASCNNCVVKKVQIKGCVTEKAEDRVRLCA